MNKKKPDNKTLDTLGRKLFESGRLPEREIDSIISNPQLFDAVCKRISEFVEEPKAASWTLQPMFLKAAAFATLVILVIAVAGLLRSDPAVQIVHENPVPDELPENARPVSPPQDKVAELSPGRAIKAVYRTPKTEPGVKAKRNRPMPKSIPSDEFYAVSYTGEDHKTAGGRIVRVELNRSALFAMGVNLPLENDSETVTADLLIGSDGVTRGLRVVK